MTDTAIRLLILISIFAAVFLSAETLVGYVRQRLLKSGAINRRLRMIEGGMTREAVTTRLRKADPGRLTYLPGPLGAFAVKFDRAVLMSGLRTTPSRIALYLTIVVAIIFALVLFGASLAGFALGLGTIYLTITFALAIGVGIPTMVIGRMARRRQKRMQSQFPTALDVFIRSLRSGHPIATALDILTTEMEDPIGSEFGLATDEVSYGVDLRDALQAMAERWDLDDVRMFVVSLSVQNETGGNLAEILENLAKVIRDRASMYMKVRALSSEGRMTATILTSLPVMAFVALFLLNPPFFLDVAQDSMFITGFSGLIILYFIGFFTIRKMIDLKV